MYFVVILFAFVMSFGLIKCHPSGAPDSVCDNLTPHHRSIEAQPSKSPFVLRGNPKNHSIELIIEGLNNTPFKGFAIQARLYNESRLEAIGVFKVKGEDLHTISCFANPGNTVTHSKRLDKKQISIEWEAPQDLSHDSKIVFVGTVVKSFDEFWTGLKSEPIPLHSSDGHHGNNHNHVSNSNKIKARNNTSFTKIDNYLFITSLVLLFLLKIVS